MMVESDGLTGTDLPDRIQNLRPAENTESEVELTMDQLARLHAHRVLDHVGGNKVRAAEILGISRTYLYDLLKESTLDQDEQEAVTRQKRSKVLTPRAPENA